MHPADAARARRAALDLATALHLDAREAVALHDSNRLTARLLPCDVVARIAPDTPEARAGAEAELARAVALAQVGAPVGRPDPRIPPQVHRIGGFAITLWEHHAARPRPQLPADEYARTLADLHAAMRTARLEVPSFTTRVDSALAMVEDPQRTPRLIAEDRAFLRGTLRELAARLADAPHQQALHGEPHPGNLLDTAGGPLAIDLETCCEGPVEFDLAHAPSAVAAHYPGVDAALLEDCRILTTALAASWRWDREDTLPDGELLGVGWLEQVRALRGAQRRNRPATPTVTILCGLPGTGKTTAATAIARATGAMRLGADDWMDRLGIPLWDAELRERIEQLQWRLGLEVLAEGVDVVVEWGTWGRSERDRLREEARALGARVELHLLDADDEELWRRISARGTEDPPLTRTQLAEYRTLFQAPTPEELALYDAGPR